MRKVWIISLVLAMVVVLLLPSAAMAANQVIFTAHGKMTSIDTGNVKQLGNSNQWLVADRHIEGEFLDGTGASITGPFALTFGGVFTLPSQKGHLQGKLECGSKNFEVIGETQPASFKEFITFGENPVPVYELKVTGNWQGIGNIKSIGSFEAYLDFVPTPELHVGYIVSSSFNMTGKYIDKN